MSFTRLSFDVTNVCNLNCAHCLRLDREEVSHLPMEIFEKALNQSQRYGTKVVIFTGGEPFLHPQLTDMVDMLVKAGVKYYIVTNGIRTDKVAKLMENEGRRKHLMSISISLEGSTEEINDRIRGKGVYRKVMATTAYLKSRGIPFGYKLSVNKFNVNDLEKFTLDAVKLGVDYVEFSHIHPTPGLIEHGLMLPRARWNEVTGEILRLSKIVKLNIVHCAGAYSPWSFYQCASMQMTDIHIDCRGNLCVCCILPYYTSGDEEKDKLVLAGNLAEMDLWDAHKRLVAIIARLNQSKIRKIAEGTFSESDHYPCIYCLKYFDKLNWIKELDPGNEWIKD